MELCVSCSKVLGERQHSFTCGLCGGRHHRTCTAQVAVEDRPLEIKKIPGATQRGRDLLVDSLGYSYNLKNVRGPTTYWWCSVRNQTLKCSAAVSERHGEFIRNGKTHNHPHDPSLPVTAKLSKEAKEAGVQEPFKAAKTIVEGLSVTEVPEHHDEPMAVPNIDLITRRVNRHRQKTRPEEPKDLDFEARACRA